MELDVSELAGGVTCARLVGRLDAEGAGLVGTRLTAAVVASGRDAVIDLSGVSFLASMGIGLLISTARGLGRKGGRLVLFGAVELVQSVLEHAAIEQIMPIVATEEQALKAVGR